MNHSDPLDYICVWDFILMGLGFVLRLMKSMNGHYKTKRLDFDWRKYFDFKHVTRWTTHLISSLIALLTLPELFVNYIQPKYFDWVVEWTIFGSAVIGFIGYDIVVLLEKIYKTSIKRKKLID